MPPRVAICLTSHNRVDCARINQEIIKLNFTAPFYLAHATSGPERAPYLEDAFAWCEPRPLHAGAVHLLQRSFALARAGAAPDFLVHLEGDTWVLDEKIILRLVQRMADDPRLLLATSAWSSPSPRPLRRLARFAWDRLQAPRSPAWRIRDFSTQFFVVRNDRALLDRIAAMRPDPAVHAERQLFVAFTRAFPLDRVLRMTEREPVHPDHRQACPLLALYCHHWPAAGAGDPRRVRPDEPGKKEALLSYPSIRRGEHLQRLLAATSYDYYNPGSSRS
jgi:hypothetical protein